MPVSTDLKRFRSLLAPTVAVAFAWSFIATSTAHAHIVSNGGVVWEDGAGKCLRAYATINDLYGQDPYVESTAQAWKEITYPPIACENAWNRPANHIRVKTRLFKLSSSGWGVCSEMQWRYNNADTYNVNQFKTWWSPPCGPGTYANNSSNQHWWNSQWVGGSMWSGHHDNIKDGNDFTEGPSDSPEDSEALQGTTESEIMIGTLPPWVDPATMTVVEAPEQVPVLDESGRVVGFVDGQELFFPQGPSPNRVRRVSEPPLPVTDASGELVGSLAAGRGFVPLA